MAFFVGFNFAINPKGPIVKPLSNGRFNVDVRLTKPGNIGLRIFGFANNNLIFQTQSGGADTYDIPINIHGMSAGMYVVILETPYGNALRKLIIR